MASQANAADKIQLKTEKDKLSYTKGVYLGNNLKRQALDVDQKILIRGLQDALSGGETLMTTKEMVEIEENFQRARAKKQEEENRIVAEKNKKEGAAFLAENAKKGGVKVLPSGLQYKVIAEGKGKKPKATDKVIVNYRGSLVDGTVFDNSDNHTEHPMTMPVSDKSLIPGWTEGLMLMSEGSKYQIVIPSNLGFKDVRMGTIGPNSVLIFEVELISIAKAAEAGKAQK
jgi:FKBP-type peptidyl-prolyl cis-trans isomerase